MLHKTGAAHSILNGAPLDAAAAAAKKIDGAPGFYMATSIDDAFFFAARRQGTILAIEITEAGVDALNKAGVGQKPIPQGGRRVPFDGDEVAIPPEMFEVFNRLREEGHVTIKPARF